MYIYISETHHVYIYIIYQRHTTCISTYHRHTVPVFQNHRKYFGLDDRATGGARDVSLLLLFVVVVVVAQCPSNTLVYLRDEHRANQSQH